MSEIFFIGSVNSQILLLNFVIILGLFTSLRLFLGALSHINSTNELIGKDNPAFGVLLASTIFAISIILTGTVYSGSTGSLADVALGVGLYSVIGFILLIITRIVFDRISFPGFSIRDEIVKGNSAVAIIDSGNIIGAAIIIRSVMMWVDSNAIAGILAIIISYIISQIIITIFSHIQRGVFHASNKDRHLKDEFMRGNIALALKFAGRRISVALAIASSTNFIAYQITDLKLFLIIWSLMSVVMIAIICLLSFIADKAILFKIDTRKELLAERNIAIGVVQSVIYISLGLLLMALVV